MDGFHGRVVACEFANRLGRDTAYGFCPLGRVLDTVDLADDVAAPLLEAVGLDPLLHVVVVVEVLGVEDMGHRQPKRRVGARAYGDPLRAQDLCRDVVDGVDEDELAPALLSKLHVVGDVPKPRDHRVEAPQDHELGIEQVRRLKARKRIGSALDQAVRQAHA